VDNANLVTGSLFYMLFVLAGENDAESIFEIQDWFNSSKGIAGYSNTQGARVGWGWDGITPSKFE
jgi:hypothetical protein